MQEENNIMRCRNCPYGMENFEKYSKFIDEENAENYIWCDKVGGRVARYGYCSDYYNFNNKYPTNKKKKINKRERYLKHQNHLKYLYKIAGGYCSTPVRYTDKIWIKGQGYIKNPKPYYQRLYRSKQSSYLKKQSNKKIRRYKGELHKGYQYIHKIYDFWYKYC